MSQFLEVLSAYVKERDVNTYKLAKYCGYDRANMYKVLNGKRKIPNIGFVRKIAEYMHLSVREEERLLEEYRVSVEGYENYHRRKSIRDFFETFSWREDSATAFSTMQVVPNWNLPEEKTITIKGAYEVEAAFFKMAAEEIRCSEGHIQMILQPEAEFLNRILGLCGHTENRIAVDHIVRLSNRPENLEEEKLYNLECIRRILPIYSYNYDYNTWYYCGNPHPEDTLFSVFPYMILTSSYACLLSSDMKSGCLTKNYHVLMMLREFFEEHKCKCRKMIRSFRNVEEQLAEQRTWERTRYNAYCFMMSPCFVPVLTEDLIDKYMNPELPHRELVIQGIMENCRHLAGWKMTYICSMEGILRFLSTGEIPEFPRELYRNIEWADRVELVRRRFLSEGSSRMKVLKKSIGSPDNYINLMVAPENGYLRFDIPGCNIILDLRLEESGILNSFYDFCESLEDDGFYKQDEMRYILEQAIRKYEEEHPEEKRAEEEKTKELETEEQS